MAKRLYVPAGLREKVAAFLQAGGPELEIVDEEPFDIRVNAGGERRRSTVDTLEAGGWIKCATAWSIARKHGVNLRQLGRLLKVLDIKVRQCRLGLFE